jgi:GNAT superfamily N-acetyltransferase
MPEALPDVSFDSPSAETLTGDSDSWKLYDSSIPSNEREPRSVILASLRKGVAFAIRARAGARTIGLAITHMLREPPTLFLIYLAVAPELRSRHIGANLFEKVWTLGSEQYLKWGLRAAGVVWEVDIPERASNNEELQQRRRRIAFFARLGAHLLRWPYVQPPVDGVASVPMHLMFRPAPGGSLPDDSAISALVRAIYFEKYGEANGIPGPLLEKLLPKIGLG